MDESKTTSEKKKTSTAPANSDVFWKATFKKNGPNTVPDTQWGWSINLQNWVVLGVNVGKYTIHWAFGFG